MEQQHPLRRIPRVAAVLVGRVQLGGQPFREGREAVQHGLEKAVARLGDLRGKPGNLRFPRLSGDRLAGGQYEPLPIEEWAPGHYRGYSEALRLYVCWEQTPVSEQARDARLEWYDPVEGVYLPGYDAVMEARDAECSARLAAEARIRQLEAENDRLRNQ